jgi:hypothetical protein
MQSIFIFLMYKNQALNFFFYRNDLNISQLFDGYEACAKKVYQFQQKMKKDVNISYIKGFKTLIYFL